MFDLYLKKLFADLNGVFCVSQSQNVLGINNRSQFPTSPNIETNKAH